MANKLKTKRENDKNTSNDIKKKKVVGNYIFGKTIGEGTFGKVSNDDYRVSHQYNH